jgi:hypothetical protein
MLFVYNGLGQFHALIIPLVIGRMKRPYIIIAPSSIYFTAHGGVHGASAVSRAPYVQDPECRLQEDQPSSQFGEQPFWELGIYN